MYFSYVFIYLDIYRKVFKVRERETETETDREDVLSVIYV